MAIPARAVFDVNVPSSGDGFISANFRNNYQSLWMLDMLPMRPRAHGSQASLADTGIMVLGTDNAGYHQHVMINSNMITLSSGDITGITPFPTGNPRVDIVYMSGDGAIRVTKGVEAASPSSPKISGDIIPICHIYQKTTATKIVNYEDKDTSSSDSYIIRDIRPMFAPYSAQSSAQNFSELDDVDVSTKASGDLVKYNGTNWVNIQKVRLDSQVMANLPVANLNSGTSASATTFWRGDATWATGMQYTDTRFSRVSATRDLSTASGTQAITGAGFAPKKVTIIGGVPDGVEASWGFGESGGNGAVISNSYAVSAGTFYEYTASNNVIYFIETASNYQIVSISAWGSDGITLNWTKGGSITGTANIAILFER